MPNQGSNNIGTAMEAATTAPGRWKTGAFAISLSTRPRRPPSKHEIAVATSKPPVSRATNRISNRPSQTQTEAVGSGPNSARQIAMATTVSSANDDRLNASLNQGGRRQK